MWARARTSPVAGAHEDGVALAHPHAGRVLGGDEQGVAVLAPVSGSWSRNTIELNCFPRRVDSSMWPSGIVRSGGSTTAKWARPSGVGNSQPSQSRGPPHCTWSPVFASVSMPAYMGTTRAISSRIACPDGMCDEVGAVRVDALGELAEDLPLGAGLPHLGPADLGAEGDAPLGGGLGAAVALLVAGGGGQQHHDLARIHQHLGGDDDVLVHAHRRAGEALGHQARVGQRRRGSCRRSSRGPRGGRRPAASTISSALRPGAPGTSKPHCRESSAADSGLTGTPPGKAVA